MRRQRTRSRQPRRPATSRRRPGANGGGDRLADLLAAHQPGSSLPQAFYNDPEIFRLDLERVFQRHWVFAGHASRVARPGDYFLFTIAQESIIIIRGKDGAVHALDNVCRHRGSRVCLAAAGSRQTLVCPYHAWTYAADGSLLSAPAMAPGFDPGAHGLQRCPVRVVEGLIFICLGADPVDAETAFRDWSTYLKPHGLAEAKIAVSMVWPVQANWKLVVENFCECYHCGPAHPEYCAVMAHAVPDTHQAPQQVAAYERLTAAWEQKARTLGNLAGRVSGDLEASHVCVRIPIKDGSLTQSPDGQPVAPLMGTFREYDGGYSGGRLYPVNYFVASCDHAVIPRFTPLGPQLTEVEMIWLVHPDAVEGRDYDRDRLTWLWKVTTDQDKQIVDDNQAGVNSRAYRPGPYSTTEQWLSRFHHWYFAQLR